MVWFQCEDCGDNLKKPKLATHFRACSANKLSCIDCGQIFGQQTVQGHTQCITETEKYGPKGQNRKPNNSSSSSAKKPKPEVDIDVGLSDRPPWFCSLCNTSATSKQTLLLHADGKKHRAKARAFHASKQPPIDSEAKCENIQNTDLPLNGLLQNESQSHTFESKKRKIEDTSENNGELIHDPCTESEKTKKPKQCIQKKIKWKKIITAVLKSNTDGILKMKKLQSQVLKTIRESGPTIDENQLVDTFEQKINSSSKFAVKGKYVKLVTKS